MQALDINYVAAQDEGSFDALKTAVESLFSATQEEFETIKNEAWYIRVFDMVTLSNKKDIRLAKQIGNIAQSQDVVLELLLRLSNTSAIFSDLLADALEKMKTHTDLSIRLAERIKRVESILCYGSAKSHHVKDLKEAGKIVLVGLIHKSRDMLVDSTSYQQQYVSGLFKTVNHCNPPSDLKSALNILDSIPDRKFLMEIILEYCVLASANSNVNSVIESVLDDLDLSPKAGAQLQEKVHRTLKLMGQEGLAAKYNSLHQVYELEDLFGVELESLVYEDEPEYILYEEKEQYNFDKFETVSADAHKIYANKIINFGSVLTLEGKITFKGCTILYNIPQHLSKINCSSNASIEFYDCEIKCSEARDSFFIEAGSAENVTLSMTRCKIIEAYNFYCGDSEGAVTRINDSVIIDPIKKVINSCSARIYFENTKINITNVERCKELVARHHDDLFYAKNIDVKNCLIVCEWPDDHKISPYGFQQAVHYGAIFYSDNLILSHSSLVGMTKLFGYCDNVEISMCDFYKCSNLTSSLPRPVKIHYSNFIKSEHLNLDLGKGSKLSFCQFIESKGATIKSGYEGGVLIESCEFYNSNAVECSAILEFQRSDDASSSAIKNSIFKGISVSSKNSYFSECLIKAYATEERNKWVLDIEDCVFSNISGTDLFQDKQTFTSWIFSDTEVTTISYKNCIGLNSRMTGDGIETKIPYRTNASDGEPIGSSLVLSRDKSAIVEHKLGVTLEKVEALGLV